MGKLVIFLVYILLSSTLLFTWIEFGGGFQIIQKGYHTYKGTEPPRLFFNKLYTSKYYGKPLTKDPYLPFRTFHLHPYYLFSLPYSDKAIKIKNNEWVTIGPTGFRKTISNTSTNRAAIVGGSTAFGLFSSSDNTTIASSLNKMTNEFNFENLNSPSWNSHQEMVAVAKNLEKNGKYLKLTVSFTLMNDVNIRSYYNNGNKYLRYPDTPEAFGKLNDCFDNIRAEPECPSNPNKFIRYLKNSNSWYMAKKMLNIKAQKEIIFPKNNQSAMLTDNKEAQLISNSILKNHKNIRRLLTSVGGRHILVIQPLYGLHSGVNPKFLSYPTNHLKLIRNVIDLVMASDFCKQDCIDLSNAFDQYPGGASIIFDYNKESAINYVFADEIHLTDIGVQYISNMLARKLQLNIKNRE